MKLLSASVQSDKDYDDCQSLNEYRHANMETNLAMQQWLHV